MTTNSTKRRFSIMSALVFFISNAFGAEISEVPKAFLKDPLSHPNLKLYSVMAFGMVALLLVIFVVVYASHVMRLLSIQIKNANGQQQDKGNLLPALKHFFPSWWFGLLYTTACCAIVTLCGFFYLSSDSVAGDRMMTTEVSPQTTKDVSDNLIDDDVLFFTRDSTKVIENGKIIFNNFNCASCHRNDGGGNAIGPNLTDEYWLHGGNIKDVRTTIKNGVPDRGMPSWGGALSPKDLRDVSFFVLSLQGTNPVDAKQPQGTPFKMVSN